MRAQEDVIDDAGAALLKEGEGSDDNGGCSIVDLSDNLMLGSGGSSDVSEI